VQNELAGLGLGFALSCGPFIAAIDGTSKDGPPASSFACCCCCCCAACCCTAGGLTAAVVVFVNATALATTIACAFHPVPVRCASITAGACRARTLLFVAVAVAVAVAHQEQVFHF
jgi:hypothetical protein